MPKLPADAGNLRSRADFQIADLFGVDEFEWDNVRTGIEAFEIPDGSGGVNPGDRRAIYNLVRMLRPEAVLEVGTHIGASTVHIASALDRNRVPGESYCAGLVSVDIRDVNDPVSTPWVRAGADSSPSEMIVELGFAGFVDFVEETSLSFLRRLEEPRFDFIFLDGSHDAANVYQEIPLALRALKPNGLILLHDYFPNLEPLWSNNAVVAGPYLATERLRGEGATIVALPLGRLPWPTKLGSDVSSLAVLAKDG